MSVERVTAYHPGQCCRGPAYVAQGVADRLTPLLAERDAAVARAEAAEAKVAAVEALADDLDERAGLTTDAGGDLRYGIGEALGLWTPEEAVNYATRATLPVVAAGIRAALVTPRDGEAT